MGYSWWQAWACDHCPHCFLTMTLVAACWWRCNRTETMDLRRLSGMLTPTVLCVQSLWLQSPRSALRSIGHTGQVLADLVLVFVLPAGPLLASWVVYPTPLHPCSPAQGLPISTSGTCPRGIPGLAFFSRLLVNPNGPLSSPSSSGALIMMCQNSISLPAQVSDVFFWGSKFSALCRKGRGERVGDVGPSLQCSSIPLAFV